MDAHTDVKLSGLTTDDTIQTQNKELSNTVSTDNDIFCSINICHHIKHGKFRKSNSIHVSHKYSQSPKDIDKEDGLELVSPQKSPKHSDEPELGDITETEMVNIKSANQTLSATPISIKHHPNSIQ